MDALVGKPEDLGGISTAEAERGQLVDGLLGLLLSPRPRPFGITSSLGYVVRHVGQRTWENVMD